MAAATYWISTWGGTGSDYGRGLVVDSSGNVYITGYTASTGVGGNDVLIAKYDSSGTLQWQRVLGGTGTEYGYGIAIDSSSNIYVTGATTSIGSGSNDVLIAKYNSSGTLQWQRIFGGTAGDTGYGIAVDSSDNIYIAAITGSTGAGSYDLLIAKYNSSGTIQWQRTLGGVGTDAGYGIAVDSSDNIYIAVITDSTGAGSYDFLIAKYNTLGTLQWQRILGGTGNDVSHSITVDSSDNVYITGRTSSTGAGSDDLLIAKYNSSGTIQWQRVLGGVGSEDANGIAVDNTDNIYVTGSTASTGSGSDDLLIAKYNSSGTLQWQRVLGGTGGDVGYAVTVDSSNNIYVTGYTSSTGAGSSDVLIAKLPSDGSLTGVYGPFTYQSCTLTDSSSSLTSATSSLTSSTSTLTDASSSLTELKTQTYTEIV